MATKRQIIEQAFNKAIGPPTVTARPGIGLIRARLEQLGDSELAPGEATNLLRDVSPDEHVMFATLYAKHQDAKNWGSHAPDPMPNVLGRIGAHPVMEKLLDGLETDAMTRELIQRRGGSDSDVLPIPELTRADVIGAAIDLHSTGE